MAYEELLKKYKKTETISPTTGEVDPTVPKFNITEIDSLKGNPYKNLVENIKREKRVQNYIAGTRADDEGIRQSMNPGVWQTVKDTVKAVPGAAVDMTKFTITHPLQATRAIGTGLADFGPTAVNTLHWLGRSVLGMVYGKENAPTEFRMPKPSETLADYLGYERSNEEKALSEAVTQYLGYTAGEVGALKAFNLDKTSLISKFGLKHGMTADEAAAMLVRNPELSKQVLNLSSKQKLLTNVLGDMSGGQLVSESQDPKERATQALFDGLFGVAQFAGGKFFRKKGEIKLKDEGVKLNDTEVVEMRGGEAPPPGGTGVKSEKGKAPEKPKTAYVAKQDLGNDARGKKIMATTEVDTKTGDAVVYYLKELDNNPQLRELVWDFEEPHILDKRLSQTGQSFTPSLKNPGGNISILESAIGSFAKKLNQTVDEVSVTLRDDIQKLANNNKVITEQFADAYGLYKNKPDMVRKKTPVLAKFFEHQLVEPRYSKNITTADSLESQIGKPLKSFEVKKPVEVKKLADEITIRVQPLKEKLQGLTKNMDAEQASKKSKGYAMEVAAIERKLRGRPTARELELATKYLNTNFRGKKVTVDGKPATLTGRTSFGKSEVIFEDKSNKFVSKESIKAPKATKESSLQYLKDSATKELEGQEAIFGIKQNKEVKVDAKKVEKQTVIKEKIVEKQSKFTKTGLDTGKRVEGKSSFNPNTIDAPEDVEILFNKMDAENKNFSGQRISKGNEDLKDLARMTGLSEDDLLQIDPGSIANSETLVAARQLVLNKAADLSNKLKEINIESASLAEKQVVRDSFLKLVSMQKSVAGLRTEASNVLRSFGVKLRPGENIAIDELISNLKKLGIEDIDTNNLAALSEAAGKVVNSMELSLGKKIGKGALQVWYASILSGPKTSIRNILATSANILSEMVSKTANPKQWKEIIPAIKGMAEGWNKTYEKGSLSKIFSLEMQDPISGKFYDAPNLQVDNVFTGKFEKFGRFTEIVGRILNRQDQRLSAVAEGMEKASLGVYTSKMTDATMKALSESYGISTVFRGLPKGRLFRAGTSATLTFLRQFPEGRVVAPFVQTIGNVLDRQFDYLPIFSALRLGKVKMKIGGKVIEFGSDILERQADDIARDFGIKDELQKQLIVKRLRDQQIGRMTLGLAMTGAAVVMAKEGMVSGVGPSNYNEKIQLQRTGWRPNSVKIGGYWIPYSYLGPIGGIFALAGNVHDSVVYDEKPNTGISDLIGYGMIGWLNTQLDNSFLSGAGDLYDVINKKTKPGKYAREFAANLTPIPQVLTQTIDISKNILGYAVGDESFRQQYETRSYLSIIRKSLGLTGETFGIFDKLNPRYDQFGQVMTNDLIWGITPSKDKAEAMKIDSFLINNDIVVTMPVFNKSYVTPQGDKKPLTEDEYNKYVKTSGRQIYKALGDYLPGLKNMPPEIIKKEVGNLVEKIRKNVRNEMFYSTNQ